LPYYNDTARPATGKDWDAIAGISYNIPMDGYGQAPMQYVLAMHNGWPSGALLI